MQSSIHKIILLTIMALLVVSALPVRPAQAQTSTFEVTKTADDGSNNTLRWAITQANSTAGDKIIRFNISTSDPGYKTTGSYWSIRLTSALPVLTSGNITIDGTASDKITPKIELDGTGLVGGESRGLFIKSSNNLVRGLIINSIPSGGGGILDGPLGVGIVISGYNVSIPPASNIVEYCYIGTNYNGTDERPNKDGGIAIVAGADDNIVQHNVISGNEEYGVYIGRTPGSGAEQETVEISENIIRNNIIGLNRTGTTTLANLEDGVRIGDNANSNKIGPGNVISGNGEGKATGPPDYGVAISGELTATPGTWITGNIVTGNLIGTNTAGTGSIPNANGGIWVYRTRTITIEKNTVSGNNKTTPNGFTGYGIIVDNRQALASIGPITIKDNVIGLNLNKTAALSNYIGVFLECGATNVTLGPGNLIGGNDNDGVQFTSSCNNAPITGPVTVTRNKVIGNQIGTSNARNKRHGISIRDGATNNTVGGAGAGDGNTFSYNGDPGSSVGSGVHIIGSGTNNNRVENNHVANNTSDGVRIVNGPVGNRITKTTTTGNGGNDENVLGIQLENGGNQEKTANVNVTSVTDGPPPRLSGSVSGCSSGCTVEVFGNLDGERDEGRFYVTSFSTNGSFSNIDITGCKPYLLFTVTDSSGNTSEFSDLSGPYKSACSPVFGVSFTPDRTGAQTASPGSITYEHTLKNTGNGSDAFTLQGSVLTSGVTGVTFSFSPAQPVTLAAGQQTTVEVTVNIPANITQSPLVTRVTATSQGDTTKRAEVRQTTPIVQNEPVPELTPPTATGSGKPGTQVTYEHTLKNVGNEAGNFTLSVSGLPSGWSGSVSPPSVSSLAPGNTQAVVVTVNILAGVVAGVQGTVTLTASAAGGTATARDTTTVLPDPQLTFTADTTTYSQNQQAGPGQTVRYQYLLTNKGNGTDTFDITVTPPSSAWGSSLQPGATITLAQGESRVVTLLLTAPEGISASPPVYATSVTASSQIDSSVNATVINNTTVVNAAVPRISPAQAQSSDPGNMVTFTHTITNVGNTTGSFDLTIVNPPAGWTVTSSSSAIDNLAPGAGTTVDVQVTPPANALAGSYTFTLRATATDSNAAVAEVVDTFNVNKVAALALTVDGSATTEQPPNIVYTYTFILENNGNFTDTIGLTLNSSQDWPVRSLPAEEIEIPPQGQRQIQVELDIPPGIIAGTVDTTTLTATSSEPGEQQDASVNTTIAAVPGVMLTPPSLTQAGPATEPVTFTFTLMNSGSITQSYSVTTTTGPTDWIVLLSPTELIDFTPGQTTTVTLVLQAPEETPDGEVGEFTLRALSSETLDNGDPVDALAIARLRIGPPIDLELAPDRASSQLPGKLVNYTHQITNTGFVSETFDLSALSSLGWETFVSPASVFLEPAAGTTISVTILVPSAAPAQSPTGATVRDTTTVTARSVTEPEIKAEVFDRTTVLQVAGVNFSPNDRAVLVPGQEILFQHTLVNIGNGFDSFTVTTTQNLDWEITVEPTRTPTLRRGGTFPIDVRVQIPADADIADINRITVRVTSEFDPEVYDEVTDTVSQAFVRGQPVVSRIYLPVVAR
jgi:uncharacterized membrane protein